MLHVLKFTRSWLKIDYMFIKYTSYSFLKHKIQSITVLYFYFEVYAVKMPFYFIFVSNNL